MSIRKARFIRSVGQAMRVGRSASEAINLVVPSVRTGSPGKKKIASKTQDRESGVETFKFKHGVASAGVSSLPASARKRALMQKWGSASK